LFLFEEEQLVKKTARQLTGNAFILLLLFPEVEGLEYITITYNVALTPYSLMAGFFSSSHSPE
jgi:hypothetical protein